MKKVGLIIFLCILLAACVAASGCISSADEESDEMILISAGYLTIGTEAQFAPFEIRKADGRFYGFDIALGIALAEEIGLEPAFVDTDFASIIPSLNADKFDIVMSAMTITEPRKENVNFSDTYFDAGLSLAVPVESDITSVDDLVGKTVGVQLGTTGDIYTTELEGVGDIKRYAHAPDAFMDMRNGNLDAIINDDVVSQPIIATYDGDFKIIGGLLTIEHYGIAVPKDNPILLESINTALAALRADGTYDEIFDEYIVNWSAE